MSHHRLFDDHSFIAFSNSVVFIYIQNISCDFGCNPTNSYLIPFDVKKSRIGIE